MLEAVQKGIPELNIKGRKTIEIQKILDYMEKKMADQNESLFE